MTFITLLSHKEMFFAHCRNDEHGLLVDFMLVTDIASDAKTQQNLMKNALSDHGRFDHFTLDVSTIVFFSGE